MARPKKFRSEEDRLLALHESTELMREVLEISGLSSGLLAKKFEEDITGITGDMIRQYSNGRRRMSDVRQLQLALASAKSGFLGTRVREIIKLRWGDDPELVKIQSDLTALSRSSSADQRKAAKAAVRSFKAALSSLVALGWNDAELVMLAIAAVRRKIAVEARTNGGIVDLAKINMLLAKQPSIHHEMVWLKWGYKSASEVGPADLENR